MGKLGHIHVGGKGVWEGGLAGESREVKQWVRRLTLMQTELPAKHIGIFLAMLSFSSANANHMYSVSAVALSTGLPLPEHLWQVSGLFLGTEAPAMMSKSVNFSLLSSVWQGSHCVR